MRFARASRVTAYEPTSRKRSAVVRRQRLERERLPLFAAEIAEGQTDPDQVLADRAVSWVERQRERRAQLARDWWRARAELRALPLDEKAAFIRYWNRSKCPANAGYMLSYLNMFRDGRIVMHAGEMHDRSNLEWEQQAKAKIQGMTDQDLDRMIQTHISPLFAEWGRQERRRRAEASAVERVSLRLARPSRRRRGAR